MLQPREWSVTRWFIEKLLKTMPLKNDKMLSTYMRQLNATGRLFTDSKLIIFEIWLVSLTIMTPFGLTQFIAESYVVEPTPASRLGDTDLVTVLLVNNAPKHIVHNSDVFHSVDYLGRYLNVRPEVGLLTSTARTFIQEGVTTEYATQVVGTTLDNGRYYAQYLKKSSRVLYDQPPESVLAVAATAVQHTPSVFTSWVGEALSGANLLPQSHNDLYNAAEQLDWRDVDDRLLGEERARDFIGNTDFVGLNDKYTGVTATAVTVVSNVSSASDIFYKSSSVNTFTNNKSDEGTASKFAVNKVQSFENLSTITVRNYFAPSGNSWESKSESIDVKNNNNDSNVAVTSGVDVAIGLPQDRTPKLYYKQLLRGQADFSTVPHEHPSVLTLPSRVLFTTTYYGFADFTTIVGDSVIVFSPNSVASQQSANILGHVTSIQGEATLSGLNNIHASNATIAIKEDLIEPPVIQPIQGQTQMQKNVQQISATQLDDFQHQINTVSVSKQDFSHFIVESSSNISTPTDILIIDTRQLESSEPSNPLIMTSTLNVDSSTNIQTPPMLSRPSDEEIRRIYASISVAAASAAIVKGLESSSIQITDIRQQAIEEVTNYSHTSENSSTVLPTINIKFSNMSTIGATSNVQILGGATTIFFEDDPFANFVEPTVTAKQAISTTAIIEIYDLSTTITTEKNIMTKNVNEVVGNIEDTTENSYTTTENLIKEEIFDQTTINTAEAIITKNENLMPISVDKISNNTKINSTVLFGLVVGEEDTSNCISRTSQVFLTQVPKTSLVALVDSVDINQATSISIETNIVPSFDISQATKYYCIQATRVIEAGVAVNGQAVNTTVDVQLEKPIVSQMETTQENSLITTLVYEYTKKETFETPSTATELEVEINTDIAKTQTESVIDNEGEMDENLDGAEDEDEEDEIELIYKTLYTTYTYLTTFFHDDTTSISSHTELITNVITSTLRVLEVSSVNLEQKNIQASSTRSNKIITTVNNGAFQNSKYVLSGELQSIIRDSEAQADANKDLAQSATATPSLELLDKSLVRKTYYTTYTYYTTIFADGDTEIMSRTEVFTNFVTDTLSSSVVTPTINLFEVTEAYGENIVKHAEENSIEKHLLAADNNKYVTMIRQHQSLEVAKVSPPGELGQYSMVTFVTDVRSSSSNGAKRIINNIMLPPKSAVPDRILNGRVIDAVGGTVIIDDQISSESNTDEILPSATLLLQTSFTTFTYYTTMYNGDNTNVASRLETITNVVTETLQPTKTVNLEETTLPITYFTTFTYWTKLAKDGEISTLSREETISNIVTPNNIFSSITVNNKENSISKINITTDIKMTQVYATNKVDVKSNTVASIESTPVYILNASLDKNLQKSTTVEVSYKTLEPTTYFTTYTYYTTSYETDRTITDSRFETITNVFTPTVTLSVQQTDNLITPPITTEPITTPTILYDYKRIIDADSISTLFFTTEILAITGVDGLLQESIRSTSSLYTDESKKLLLTSTQNSVLISLSVDDNSETIAITNTTPRQYKIGLVRLIDGTRVANRTTTLYQSKVIGTIIDNRYAQIIESTSSFLLDKTELPGIVSVLNMTDVIKPTSTQEHESQMNKQSTLNVVTLPSSVVRGSINKEEHNETNTETNLDSDEQLDEGENLEGGKPGSSNGRFGIQNKKRTFTPVIRPFASRNRPQFAPKKKNASASSATIITRSDFTPTITATLALKSSGFGRFSSSRRGGISSSPISDTGSGNAAFGSSSSRRFGRPSRLSVGGSGIVSNTPPVSIGVGATRSRLSSSRLGSTLGSRRLGGSFIRSSATGGFRSGFSSVYAGGNSRLRIKPTNSLSGSIQNDATDNVPITSTPDSSAEEDAFIQDQSTDAEGEENITDSNRRNQNSLLKLRRPLNRPAGFTSVGARPRPGNAPGAANQVSTRKNPLTARAKTTTVPVTAATTTTARPKSHSFQRPAITSFQNRSRPQSSLFPPRSLFQAQRPVVIGEDRKQDNSDTGNDSEDDSEYEDDEEEGDEEENEDGDVNRRRRSNRKINKSKILIKPINTPISNHITEGRVKRDTTNARTNFRSRFRRPKPITPVAVEQREVNTKESINSETSTLTTSRTRIGSRFSSRYQHTTGSSTLLTTEPKTTVNYRGIRPTRPTNGRAQFTLREKDTVGVQKPLTRPGTTGTSSFRRPKTAASSRRPTSNPNSGSKPSNGNRRLKNYNSNSNTGNNNDSSGRNSGVARSRAGTTASVRNRNSNNNRGRNRNEYNNDQLQSIFDGTITVTHVVPAEVTIPVVNGKVTEYRNVITGKTNTEIVGPQQWTSFVGTNDQTTLALTRQDSSVNYAGVTEITQYILHESSTTTITFTPTTIRGRKTSFSHILPSTAYSVEQIVSTAQPQISANAPLANILLSQLLLGNIGLPGANPLLVTQVPGLAGLNQAATKIQVTPATPITEFRTHASTYVTTLFEGMSTVLPVTFQGKKILTTVYDTTAQTITATEFITDTIVTTPTAQLQQQQQPAAGQVNSLLLQQLLLQQQLQPHLSLDVTEPILQSAAPQLLYSDQLQELDTNNIRLSQEQDNLEDLNTFSLTSIHKSNGNRKKPGRKTGKSHKRNKAHQQQDIATGLQESSIITLYVSGRRPGEFSTILSTVYTEPSILQKRQATASTVLTTILDANSTETYYNDYYTGDGSEIVPIVAKVNKENQNTHRNNADVQLDSELSFQSVAESRAAINNILSENDVDNELHLLQIAQKNVTPIKFTQSLESIVGDVGLWYTTSTQTYNKDNLKASLNTAVLTDFQAQPIKSKHYFLV